MADLIDRQEALEGLYDVFFDDELSAAYPNEADKVLDVIRKLQSAQPEACDDAISRDDAIMAVKTGALSAATIFGRTDEGATAYYETVKAIKALPSSQPERTKAKWEKTEIGWKCSNCTLCTNIKGKTEFNFCPNCGCRMEGESE